MHKKATEREWIIAQEYERAGWMDVTPFATSDRQEHHLKCFSGYENVYALDEKDPIRRAIEFGCGPFTNLKLIRRQGFAKDRMFDLTHITLLDPLIHTYLTHNYCGYKNCKMDGMSVKVKACPMEIYRNVSIQDMSIMINVLDHCFDIEKCLGVLATSLRPDGVLVFHESCFEEKDYNRACEERKCPGHPLCATLEFYNDWLSTYFNPKYHIYYNDLYPPKGRRDLYFIGTKK
jgi:SAM-dependent methyltransferase